MPVTYGQWCVPVGLDRFKPYPLGAKHTIRKALGCSGITPRIAPNSLYLFYFARQPRTMPAAVEGYLGRRRLAVRYISFNSHPRALMSGCLVRVRRKTLSHERVPLSQHCVVQGLRRISHFPQHHRCPVSVSGGASAYVDTTKRDGLDSPTQLKRHLHETVEQ